MKDKLAEYQNVYFYATKRNNLKVPIQVTQSDHSCIWYLTRK